MLCFEFMWATEQWIFTTVIETTLQVTEIKTVSHSVNEINTWLLF